MQPVHPQTLNKAAYLAQWLIENRGVQRKRAYIISARKHRIADWHMIQKRYQEIKPKQLQLIIRS